MRNFHQQVIYLISKFKLSGKSLMSMRQSNGPKIEPCGTPTRIGAQSES